MRPQPDLPRRPSRRERRRAEGRPPRLAGRGRAIVGFSLIALLVLLISLRGLAKFYTDYLWFDSLHLGSVWSRILITKLVLTGIGAAVFFVVCWGNLLIADRLAPMFRPTAGEDDLIERYHEFVGSRARTVRFAITAFLSLVVGLTLGGAWNQWVLFSNYVSFGRRDATYGTDIGFYVFRLPFLTTVAGWVFSTLLLVLFVTMLAHILNGGIRFHTQMDRVTPQVKAHISVLLGALALVQVLRYWLERYELTFSTRGKVDGATYTAVNVEQRVLYLLMFIALFSMGLFIANIWRRGWVLPGMAVTLWVLVSVLAGTVVPGLVQRLRVEPNELSLDGQYVAQNIRATRQAYGLDDVTREQFNSSKTLDAADLEDDKATLSNIRLWDPTVAQDHFTAKQKVYKFYAVTDVDVDRYTINDQRKVVMIAARDLSDTDAATGTWETSHLAYTHGYGVIASLAGEKQLSGDARLVAKDIPVEVDGMPRIDRARAGTYFGEDKSGYVIVDTKRREIDYQAGTTSTRYTTYQGKDGVAIGSGAKGFVRKLAFALRFGDVNPLVSSNITSRSKVLLERDVTARVKAIAPFLAYDHDPYMVMLEDGKLVYVLDGYTTTRNFPNAQRADTGGLDEGSGLRGRSFNYARNSVKAVVDAYDGTVTLYVVDQKDPIIRAYNKAFPELFTPLKEAGKDLRNHFRYPEDLFAVQTQMWAKYHVDDRDVFLNGDDFWSIPSKTGGRTTDTKDKSSTSVDSETEDLGADGQPLTAGDRYQSQYVLMQLPGDDKESFVLLRPYGAASSGKDDAQRQLRAFITVSSEPGEYGQIRTFLLPSNDLPDGPSLAADDISSQKAVAAVNRDLCSGKNVCTYTAPQIVPVGESLLYVQSLFVAGQSVKSPRLEYVIVSYYNAGNPEVAIDTNLRDALIQLFGDDVPQGVEDTGSASGSSSSGNPSEQPSKTTSLAEQERDLIDKIVKEFAAADAAGRSGDQVAYAEHIEKASEYATRLQSVRDRIDQEQASGKGGKGAGTSGSGTGSGSKGGKSGSGAGSGSGSGSGSKGSTSTTSAPTTTTTTAPRRTTVPNVTTTTAAGA